MSCNQIHNPEADARRAVAQLRLALGGFLLLMLALSWPLWTDGGGFPRIPWLRGDPISGIVPSAAVAFGLAASVAAAILLGFSARPSRLASALDLTSVLLLLLLVLGDQGRLQPWVYQYALWSFAFGTARPGLALNLSRLFIVALYVHSGLSKLDFAFCHGLGSSFFSTAAALVGLQNALELPGAAVNALILAMPAWELAVGIGLCFERTRRIALVGAVVLHSALIAILGPWGLGHSTIVLVWNIAMIVEDVLLFRYGRQVADQEPATTPRSTGQKPHGSWSALAWWLHRFLRGLRGLNRREALLTASFLVLLLLPFGERWGIWDAWPSFALYAGHVERADILVNESELDSLAPTLKRHLGPVDGGGWARLDVTGWSREARGVPDYPQGRTANGIAEAVACWGGRPRLVRLRSWTRADRFSGRRVVVELFGLDAIRRRGDRYWLNAHPAYASVRGRDGRP